MKTRLWCFTNFNLDFNYLDFLEKSTATYILYGHEKCPKTLKEHHQGFVYFDGARSSKKGVSKQLGNAHVEPCRGNLDQNTDYCSKDSNVVELGEKPKQGHRTDLDSVKDQIMEQKLSVDQICIDNPNLFHQYGRTLSKLEDIALRKRYRTTMTEGIWIWGESGFGKSHKAFEGYSPETHYVYPNDNGWWDGYTGQEIVIINEFRGQIPYYELLDLCDKWPKTVKRRSREPVPFLAKKLIITSCMPPNEVYHNLSAMDDLEQLERRFEIIKMEQKWSKGNTEL